MSLGTALGVISIYPLPHPGQAPSGFTSADRKAWCRVFLYSGGFREGEQGARNDALIPLNHSKFENHFIDALGRSQSLFLTVLAPPGPQKPLPPLWQPQSWFCGF